MTSETVINNKKALNKEIPEKWREVVNNNVNEESVGAAERKRNRENGATERLIRRAQPTEEQWFMSHMVERWVILALLQNPQPPTHTDNPLSYSLTQAQPLGRVIVKFSLTDSVIPPDSIKYKEKHLTMRVKSNRAQSANFAHWQTAEKQTKTKQKSMCTYQREKHFSWHLRTSTQTKWQTWFSCPEGLPRKQRNENALCSLDQISNLSDILYDSKPNTPGAEKKISIMGKPTESPYVPPTLKTIPAKSISVLAWSSLHISLWRWEALGWVCL